MLISEPTSTRALLVLPSQGRGAVANPRIVRRGAIRSSPLPVQPRPPVGEGANAFRAEFEDAQHYRYPLEVVGLAPATQYKDLRVQVRLGRDRPAGRVLVG